jgi:hypothetical protein
MRSRGTWKQNPLTFFKAGIIMKIINIKSASDFVIEIEMIVKDKKCEYMDAIMIYCERNNMEVETVADIIKHNSILKAKLQYEAEVMNMMKRTSRLPI